MISMSGSEEHSPDQYPIPFYSQSICSSSPSTNYRSNTIGTVGRKPSQVSYIDAHQAQSVSRRTSVGQQELYDDEAEAQQRTISRLPSPIVNELRERQDQGTVAAGKQAPPLPGRYSSEVTYQHVGNQDNEYESCHPTYGNEIEKQRTYPPNSTASTGSDIRNEEEDEAPDIYGAALTANEDSSSSRATLICGEATSSERPSPLLPPRNEAFIRRFLQMGDDQLETTIVARCCSRFRGKDENAIQKVVLFVIKELRELSASLSAELSADSFEDVLKTIVELVHTMVNEEKEVHPRTTINQKINHDCRYEIYYKLSQPKPNGNDAGQFLKLTCGLEKSFYTVFKKFATKKDLSLGQMAFHHWQWQHGRKTALCSCTPEKLVYLLKEMDREDMLTIIKQYHSNYVEEDMYNLAS